MSKVVTMGRALTRVLALLGVLVPAQASAQLSVDELEVFLRANGSAQRTGVIGITNDSDDPVQAMLELQDWNRDDGGTNRYFPVGTTKGTCGDRLKIFPASVRIEARRTESVRVTFEGDAAAACWAIVFIQANEPPKAPSERSHISYIIRTGVKVYVEAGSAQRHGEIDSLQLQLVPAGPTDTAKVPGLEVLFRSIGTAHMKPTGAVEVRSADNQVVAKLDIEEFPIAPGDIRRLKLALPKVPGGRYIALALIDYGGAEIAAAQLEFTID